MRHLLKLFAIAAVIGLGGTALANATVLQLSTSFDVTADEPAPNTFPEDVAGLDGASMVLDLFFDAGTTFSDGFAPVSSATLSVTGASIASSNGVFDINDPLGLFASGTGGVGTPTSLFGSTLNFPFEVAGIFASARFDAGGSVQAANGDLLTLAILQDVSFTFARPTSNSTLTGEARQQYTPRNLMVTASEVAPIPLPAALPLMLAGLGGLALFARRRRSAA